MINNNLKEFSDHDVTNHIKLLYEETDFDFKLGGVSSAQSWKYNASRYILHREGGQEDMIQVVKDSTTGREYSKLNFLTR